MLFILPYFGLSVSIVMCNWPFTSFVLDNSSQMSSFLFSLEKYFRKFLLNIKRHRRHDQHSFKATQLSFRSTTTFNATQNCEICLLAYNYFRLSFYWAKKIEVATRPNIKAATTVSVVVVKLEKYTRSNSFYV